jgi:hypothetical protein
MNKEFRSIFSRGDFYKEIAEKKIVFFTWNLMQREFPYHVAAIANAVKLSKGSMILVVANQLSNLETEHYDSASYLKELNSRFDVEVVQMKTTRREVLRDFEQPNFGGMRELESYDAELYRSILSSWLSKNLATLEVDRLGRKLQRLLSQDVAEYRYWRSNAECIIEKYSANLVIVMNGRHHTNVAARRSAQALGIKHLFFESGVPRQERIFLQNWQPHDASGFSNYCLQFAESLESQKKREVIKWASLAMQDNRSKASANPNLLFQQSISSVEPTNDTVVPIFTSSTNENFSNLPHLLNGWDSPDDAILETAREIRSMGLIPIVRIHPNAGWKLITELLGLIEKLKAFNVNYVLPWSSQSSYSLIQKSKFFITWSSTLALEGTAMGVHAYTLAKTHYEAITDIKNISREGMKTWDPMNAYDLDSNKSLLQYYIQNNHGLLLDKQLWVENTRKPHRKAKYRKVLILCKLTFKAFRSPLKARPYDFYFLLIKLFNKSLADRIMSLLFNLMLNYRKLRKLQ